VAGVIASDIPSFSMIYPHKPAPADFPIADIFVERWSPRAMSEQPIEEEKIQTLFEAARWAPSSSNLQPWHYIYATKDDGAMRLALESLLAEGNSWAKHAYLLLISFAYTKRKKSDGTFADNYHHLHDTGAATYSIALQCEPLGLVGHQMAGFDMTKANELLGVPADYVPGSMMAIGYPADVSILPEPNRSKESALRQRKTQEEFVYHGRWSN